MEETLNEKLEKAAEEFAEKLNVTAKAISKLFSPVRAIRISPVFAFWHLSNISFGTNETADEQSCIFNDEYDRK